MTKLDMDEIERVCEAATKEPWGYIETPDGYIGVEIDDGHQLMYELEGSCLKCFANMQFIASARTWLPALVAELREARDALLTVQARSYYPIEDRQYCDYCHNLYGRGHKDDCPFAILDIGEGK